MSRYHVALLALLCFISGCKPRATTTLRFLVVDDPAEKETWNGILASHEKDHPTFRVELIFQSDLPSACADLEKSFQSESPIDCWLMPSEYTARWVSEGKALDLSSRIPSSPSWVHETRANTRVQLQTYGVPIRWSAVALYFHSNLFETRGIPLPSTHWDWSDLLESSRLLTAEPDPEGRIPLWGLDLSGEIEDWLPFILQNQGEIHDDDRGWVLNDPQFVQSNIEAVDFYAGLIRDHHVAQAPPLKERTIPHGLFIEKKAAMTFADRKLGAQLQRLHQTSWNVIPLPKGRTSSTLMSVDSVTVSSKTPHPDACWNWIAFLLSETTQSRLMMSGSAVSVLPQLFTSRILTDFPGPFAVRNSVHVESLPWIKPLKLSTDPQPARQILTEEMLALILDSKRSPREMLNRAQARLEELDLTRQLPKHE